VRGGHRVVLEAGGRRGPRSGRGPAGRPAHHSSKLRRQVASASAIHWGSCQGGTPLTGSGDIGLARFLHADQVRRSEKLMNESSTSTAAMLLVMPQKPEFLCLRRNRCPAADAFKAAGINESPKCRHGIDGPRMKNATFLINGNGKRQGI